MLTRRLRCKCPVRMRNGVASAYEKQMVVVMDFGRFVVRHDGDSCPELLAEDDGVGVACGGAMMAPDCLGYREATSTTGCEVGAASRSRPKWSHVRNTSYA